MLLILIYRIIITRDRDIYNNHISVDDYRSTNYQYHPSLVQWHILAVPLLLVKHASHVICQIQ